jgi:anti-anti-sigma factor
MKIVAHGDTLTVSDIQELAAATASSFQTELSAALRASFRQIEFDLSETTFVDCGGLAALVAIRKLAGRLGTATVSLLNPPQAMQRMVNLLNLNAVFPVQTTQTLGFAKALPAH